MRTKPLGAAVYGIDLSKTSFHVVGTDVKGNLLQRDTLNRSNIFEFFANASVALIAWRHVQGRNGWHASLKRWATK